MTSRIQKFERSTFNFLKLLYTMAEIVFCKAVAAEDPDKRPCTIVGKREHLKIVPFQALSPLLAPRVTEEVSYIICLLLVLSKMDTWTVE